MTKKALLLGLVVTMASLSLVGGQNQLSGQVTFPVGKRTVQQGSGYNKDGTPMMHSDDPMSRPDRNVIVSLHPLSFQAEARPLGNASITQREQTFLPHVLPVTPGTTVYFLNEDEFFHNIYSLTPGSRFNIGRRPPGSPYPIKIKRAGPITLSCDIHPHMKGIILSLETPFFTRVDEAGRFWIGNLPDGEYRLEVFHPESKKLVQQITLRGGERKSVQLDLNRPNRP